MGIPVIIFLIQDFQLLIPMSGKFYLLNFELSNHFRMQAQGNQVPFCNIHVRKEGY